MAHIVGVPKREPCQKCSMPVFLAERLTVGKKVYHRTCLKCARCNTQLTPGSFYETEIDGEYCCETCPDEERSISPHKRIDDNNFSIPSTATKTTSSNRFSSKIADRLAFFENTNRNSEDENTSKRLLQKSLSDEEKSQSLKKFEEDQKNVYQTNTAFNKFLNSHFSDVTDLASGTSDNNAGAIREPTDILRRDSATSVTTTTSDSDGNSDEETTDDQYEEQNKEDLPPDLPKSLPPFSSNNDDDQDNNISGKRIKTNTDVSFKSIQSENKLNEADNSSNWTPSIAISITSSKNLTDDENVIDDRNVEQKLEQNEISVIEKFSKTSCNTEISIHDNNDLKNSFNVAKDSFDDDNDADDNNKEDLIKNKNKMRTSITPDYLADIDSNTTTNNNNDLNNSKEADDNDVYNNDKMSNLSSMVRTRLNQFENCIANNKISSENTIVSININDKYAKNEIINSSTSGNNNDNIKEISYSINNQNDKDQFQMSINNKNDINEKQNENKSLESLNDENEVPKNVSITIKKIKNNENSSSDDDHNDHKMITNKQNEKDKNASFHNNEDITLTELECKNYKTMIENQEQQQQQKDENQDKNQEISMGIININSKCDNHNVKEIKQQIVLSKENKQIKVDADDDDDAADDKKQLYYSSALNDVELNATAVTNEQITTQKDVTIVRDDDINDKQSDHMYKDGIQDGDKNKENTNVYKKNAVSSVSSSSEKSATLRKITLSPEMNSNLASSKMRTGTSTLKLDEYPEELNPFKSDDENDEENEKIASANLKKEKRKSLNPFESDDEDNLNEGSDEIKNEKVKPPRPPPPKKISTNPFGSESEDEDDASQTNSNSGGTSSKRTPVPTPRNYLSKSQNPTPEPTPRITRQCHGSSLKNSEDYYNSNTSLSPINIGTKLLNGEQFVRDENCRGSTYSLTSSGSGTGTKRKTKKAPAPPPPPNVLKAAKELFPTPENDSKKSSPSSSNAASPKFRKKRPAPAPPSINSKVESSPISSIQQSTSIGEQSKDPETVTNQTIIEAKLPNLDKLSDEEKVLLENNTTSTTVNLSTELPSINYEASNTSEIKSETTSKRRLIALDASLIEDSNSSHDLKLKEEENVIYRRKIMPPVIDSFFKDNNDTISTSIDAESEESHDRQLEKLKDNKEAKNRNRQSHVSLNADDNDPLLNKSVQGKWKRRKGPAPALPVPPRKVLQMLPLQEIRHELEVIEVQQQGLEKQGVMLEKMIRDRCEGQNSEDNNSSGVNSKEVEDLILQLFELVNEKNELFRRQAELMYLRRQHRLEQEQADLEYEIRVLMAQPERNKTDSDKAREESLIARLIEVVQLRNEVIECLEMDRLREAEEDMSIKQRLEMHTAKRDEELSKQTPTKLSKKEKKKQKELKKLVKSKKLDADKDADESEINNEKLKSKKKKKKFLF